MTNADPALIDDLVSANRILYDQGVVDGFGHVSGRHDKNSERFLLARSMAPGLVTADDLMEFELSGEPVDARGRTPYLERFIHSEIYKAYPAVQAIVHSHSPSIIPFSVVTAPLRPIYHMGSFLGLGHARHRWLSGLMMSKHDARFSGRQEHLGDLCTKAHVRLFPHEHAWYSTHALVTCLQFSPRRRHTSPM